MSPSDEQERRRQQECGKSDETDLGVFDNRFFQPNLIYLNENEMRLTPQIATAWEKPLWHPVQFSFLYFIIIGASQIIRSSSF